MVTKKAVIIMCCFSALFSFLFISKAIALLNEAAYAQSEQIICADLNKSGKVDINDYNILYGYLYLETWLPSPLCLSDVNGDAKAAQVSDLEYLRAYLFEGGVAPVVNCCDSFYAWKKIGPFDGDGPHIIRYDPINKNIIYIGNNGHDGLTEGLYKSVDYGENWLRAFERPISSFCVDPKDSKTLYVGAEPGGLYKSKTAAASWSKLTSSQPYFEIAKFTSIVINPKDPSIIFAAGNYFFAGYFLYASFDAGASWNLILDNYRNPGISKLLFDPLDPQILYGLVPGKGVCVSLNAGASWEWRNDGISDFNLYDIVGGLANDNGHNYCLIYVASIGGGVFFTDNRAQAWFSRNEGLSSLKVSALGLFGGNPLKVYAGTDKGLFYSDNAGLNWKAAPDLPIYHYYTEPELNNSPILGLAVDPNDSNQIYASKFDIVYKSKDAGSSWDFAGLPITNITSIAVNPLERQVIYTGARFGSSVLYKSSNQGQDWQGMKPHPYLSDVAAIEIDSRNPSIVYIGSYNMPGGFYKSIDAGQSWIEMNEGLQSQSIEAIALDSNDSNVLYLGTLEGVFKSDNAGLKWQKTAMSLRVSSLEANPMISGVIYAGTYGNGLYKTVDGGASWAELMTGLEGAKFRDIKIDPVSPNTIYATTMNNGIIKSVDGGQSWIKVNSGLPGIPVYALLIVYNRSSSKSEIFAGTWGDGVYRSKDGGNSWQRVNIDGMDFKKITVLSYTINTSRDLVLIAGTYGGGIYRKIIPIKTTFMPIQY
ncbi:MAG: hypothetical protein AB1629_06280 [Candidatus Omnitrophota bacterium]